MIVYPAIDIYKGRGVRLKKGNFKEVTDYGAPEDLINIFKEQGSKFCHVVDLNGAKSNDNQDEILMNLLGSKGMKIQIAGGIRSIEQAEKLLNQGADKIVLGSSVISDFSLFETLLLKYPEAVAVAIDAVNNKVAIEGWVKSAGDVESLIEKLKKTKLKRLIYTDISRDGMMAGPNFKIYEKLVEETDFEIIASGGITSLEDVKALKRIGVKGVIIGKSLYEHKIKLKEAIDVS